MDELSRARPVPGYEGRYFITPDGAIWSHPNRLHDGLWLVQSMRKGYRIVNLCHKGGKGTRNVHALVAAAFIGERPYGMQINHKNGNKLDNHYENLEYVTPMENTRHAYDSGLIDKKKVSENGRRAASFAHAKMRKFNQQQVTDMRTKYAAGATLKSLADEYQADASTIGAICKRETYKDF